MNFLHYDVDAQAGNVIQAGDVIEVTLDKQANVRLLDDVNYGRYRRGEKHTYHDGGLAKQSPIYLHPLHAGSWHVVVDLGGYAGTVRASVRVVSRQNA